MTGLEASAGERVGDWLEEGRRWSESELANAMDALGAPPEVLLEAMKHALLAGGKRLRPSLVRLFCLAAGGEESAASAPAVAIEMVHTYSLIHDDLPCMDDDDVRRGLPTVHRKWDEATAVLAGDALLTEAFGLLAACPEAGDLATILARAAGASGMVGGQVLDLEVDLSALPAQDHLEAVERVHRAKTAALFGAACELGWVAGGGAAEDKQGARQYGLALGLLFQATDDIIDVTGTVDGLGKTPGKDVALERPTLVAALGLEGARARAGEHAANAQRAALGLELGEGHPAHDLVGYLLARTH